MQLLVPHLESLLVSQASLDLTYAHVVLILAQLIIILDDIALQLLLCHLLVEQELHLLLLQHSPLEFHRSVPTHPLHHDSV